MGIFKKIFKIICLIILLFTGCDLLKRDTMEDITIITTTKILSRKTNSGLYVFNNKDAMMYVKEIIAILIIMLID